MTPTSNPPASGAIPRDCAGLTLVEILVAISLTVVLTAGSIAAFQGLRGTDASFNRLADVHMNLIEVESRIRDDLGRAVLSPNMEPFQEIVDDPILGATNTTFHQERVTENSDSFFNRSWDVFTAVDDHRTQAILGDTRFFGRNYPAGSRIDESAGLPLPDPRTPFNEAVVEGVNQPFGPVYDYFGGILNNGLRDVIYFGGRVSTPSGVQQVAIAYRLVERSDIFNADRGSDGILDEFEPGYHPRYRRDPSLDNVGNGRRIEEGDGRLTGAEAGAGGNADDREPNFELQRVIYSLEPDPVQEILVPQVRSQVISTDIVEFNVLYYDRLQRRYVDPPHLVTRFGYPQDFGAPVVAVGPQTFRYVEVNEQTFLDPNDPADDPRHIFLYQLNLDWTEGDDPSTLYTVEPRTYTIDRVIDGGKEFTVAENISARFGDPIRSVAGAGAVGYVDASGILRSRAVRDGFRNLEPGDEIYLEQRPLRDQFFRGTGLLGRKAAVDGGRNPVRENDDLVYLIKPGLYRVTEKRGEGIRVDLEGQQSEPGVPVIFRAPFFPPSVKIELTIGRDPLKYNLTVPLVLRLPQE